MTTDLERRVSHLEALRESDRKEYQDLRHAFRNEVTALITKLQARVGELENKSTEWTKWALSAAGAVIAFLAAMIWGKK